MNTFFFFSKFLRNSTGSLIRAACGIAMALVLGTSTASANEDFGGFVEEYTEMWSGSQYYTGAVRFYYNDHKRSGAHVDLGDIRAYGKKCADLKASGLQFAYSKSKKTYHNSRVTMGGMPAPTPTPAATPTPPSNPSITAPQLYNNVAPPAAAYEPRLNPADFRLTNGYGQGVSLLGVQLNTTTYDPQRDPANYRLSDGPTYMGPQSTGNTGRPASAPAPYQAWNEPGSYRVSPDATDSGVTLLGVSSNPNYQPPLTGQEFQDAVKRDAGLSTYEYSGR